MNTQEQIETTVFCRYYDIDNALIDSLADNGLIELQIVERRQFIPHSQLSQLEKLIRLHRDLDINVEGLQAIAAMLNRLEILQLENVALKNRLRFYREE